jgi:hypothetical protein
MGPRAAIACTILLVLVDEASIRPGISAVRWPIRVR